MYPTIFAFFCGPGFWLLMVAVFVVLELSTTALVAIWFVAGSVAALLVSLISGLWWPQWLVFALVSAVSQQLAKPLVARLRNRRAPATDVERNVGRVATVLTPIGPGRQGRARLDGVDWNALCAAPLEPGDICLVLQIEGTALVVAPMPKNPPPPSFPGQEFAGEAMSQEAEPDAGSAQRSTEELLSQGPADEAGEPAAQQAPTAEVPVGETGESAAQQQDEPAVVSG